MADAEKIDRLVTAFKAADATGNGRLAFPEFFALLKKGNPNFDEEQATDLFEKSDQDMSGELDFDEFVEYIFNNKSMNHLFLLESSSMEEECKQTLLGKTQAVRAEASKAVKDRGESWRDLTWRQRLDEVKDIEKGAAEHHEDRATRAPIKDPSSMSKAPSRARPKTGDGGPSPGSTSKTQKSAVNEKVGPGKIERVEVAKAVAAAPAAGMGGKGMGALLGGMPKGLSAAGAGPTNKFAIAEMSQTELVAYSLQEDDLDFAGGDPAVKAELQAFRDYLKTATSPLDKLDVIKFIAKGTAGWVFLAQDKESGARCALKLIRMTQARSGIKEWYCSKVLKTVGVSNVVFTDETVRVVERSSAPEVIGKELEKAGPVNYFMCMVQELMPWGTLEDLAKEGELSPEIMFKCLEDVAKTLAIAHANGLQHRDVKPENIMLQMNDDDDVLAAKLCDFGSSMVGDDPKSCQDDIRRFGVTLFSVATGEGWTKNRLIREKHDALVERLGAAVAASDDPSVKRLPQVLEQILSGSMSMAQVASVMEELGDAYDED